MRNLIVTLPARLRLAWRAFAHWWHAAILAWIDRYLAARHEERAPVPLDFDELPVLYDEANIPVLFDEVGGFGATWWPKSPEAIDYGDSSVLS